MHNYPFLETQLTLDANNAQKGVGMPVCCPDIVNHQYNK